MKKTILTLIATCIMTGVFANNIAVSNTSLSGQVTATQTITINFDLSWENSWRTSTNENNYDGAWVFVKFRKNGTQNWQHCTLNTNGIIFGTGDSIKVTPDGKGAFVYRNANGIGNVNFTGNKLIWNYGADNVLNNDNVEIAVFSLEMVYIPTGNFYLGSGGTENFCFKDGNTTNPYHVLSAGAITVGNTVGSLNFNGLGSGTSIPATFPNGYNAFWIMKYECSQQQYADFLNHLTLAQATSLKLSGATVFGSTTWPNFQPLAAERANNYVNIDENLALADWSGLRPLSEMEFEKACRGVNITPVPNEYAWGTTLYTPLTSVQYALTDSESVNLPSNANVILGNGINRPVRVGIFARTTGSTRELSGATYYGVMNMSDNLHEITIYSGNNAGQSIDASVNGDGNLDLNGNTDISSWVPTAFGLRGEYFNGGVNYMRVSERINANYTSNGYSERKTARLARTAQ